MCVCAKEERNNAISLCDCITLYNSDVKNEIFSVVQHNLYSCVQCVCVYRYASIKCVFRQSCLWIPGG